MSYQSGPVIEAQSVIHACHNGVHIITSHPLSRASKLASESTRAGKTTTLCSFSDMNELVGTADAAARIPASNTAGCIVFCFEARRMLAEEYTEPLESSCWDEVPMS